MVTELGGVRCNCISPAQAAMMLEPPNCQADSTKKAKKYKELSNSARKLVIMTIVSHLKDGVLPWGIFKKPPKCLESIAQWLIGYGKIMASMPARP